MIGPTITIDMSSFNRTLAEYIGRVPHTITRTLNKKMYYIARGAWRLTPVAERSAIEASFNVSAKERVSKKTGKVRRSYNYSGLPAMAYALATLRLKRRGEALVRGEALKKLARAIVARRIKAIRSLAAGWIKPIKIFARLFIESNLAEIRGPRIKSKGAAWPAKDGWNPMARVSYEMASVKPDGSAYIDPRVEAALGTSFRNEQASMEAFLRGEMQKDINA